LLLTLAVKPEIDLVHARDRFVSLTVFKFEIVIQTTSLVLFLEFRMLLHHLVNTLIALISGHCSCNQTLLVLPLDLTGRLEPQEVIDH
jgi:hypothetical protein